MKIKIRNFRQYERNTLKGFCCIEFPDLNLLIEDCTVHQKNASHWIGFPAKKNDEGTWRAFVRFTNDESRKDFKRYSEAVLKDFFSKQGEKGRNDDIPF